MKIERQDIEKKVLQILEDKLTDPIDEVQAAIMKAIWPVIDYLKNLPSGYCLTLLRKLYDTQNDAPLERDRDRWEKIMKEVNDYLLTHEKRFIKRINLLKGEVDKLTFDKQKSKEQLNLPVVISRFIFDTAEKLNMQCNEICVTIDPCYSDDKYVDIVIYDDSWNELKRIKTYNGL